MRALSHKEIQVVSGAQGASVLYGAHGASHIDHFSNAAFTLGICGAAVTYGAICSPLWAAGSISAVAPHVLLSSTSAFTLTSVYLFSFCTYSSYLDSISLPESELLARYT